MGDGEKAPLRLKFNPKVRLEFHGSTITSDAGLLPIRELDEALGLTGIASDYLQDRRTGRNIRHHLGPLLRQSIFSRLAGYDDTNDADRLAQDPAMRVVVGLQGSERKAASTSEMGRFETELLTQEVNLQGLARMNAQWVERAMANTLYRRVILDMDSSESPVHGQQEGAAYNGHFECVCYHPLFLFNQFGDCEGATLRPGNVHSADGWQELLEPVVKGYRKKGLRLLFRVMPPSPSPRCTSIWNKRRLGTPSGFQLTRYFREKSRICWYGLLSGLLQSPSSLIMTSSIRPRVGRYPEEWQPGWSGIRENCFPE
jgi:hypothetical protein